MGASVWGRDRYGLGWAGRGNSCRIGVESSLMGDRRYQSTELTLGFSSAERMAACAAASLAIGTLYGEQLT